MGASYLPGLRTPHRIEVPTFGQRVQAVWVESDCQMVIWEGIK